MNTHNITRALGALFLFVGLLVSATFGQTPAPETFVKGTVNIRYSTRTQLDGDKPKEGVTDLYTFDLNVANNAGFRGTISHLPFVKYLIETQKGQLTYAVDLDAINPRNPAQRLNVGKLIGAVPVDENNIYRFTDGTAKASMFPVGRAAAFESTMKGLAAGKPPVVGERAVLFYSVYVKAIEAFTGNGSFTLDSEDEQEAYLSASAAVDDVYGRLP